MPPKSDMFMFIFQIERIQNKSLYWQYETKKKEMQNEKPNLPASMPLERELWHGTQANAIDGIVMHGFNRSYAGDNGKNVHL